MSHKILAIDDSLTFRKFISKALGQTPGRYVVTLAQDGTEGLDKASGMPDLILLDYVLPDLSGDEVCERLSAMGTMNGIPIVLMSSSVESIRATAAKYPSVKGMVAKPFTPELLCDTVEQLLSPRPEGADTTSPNGARTPSTPPGVVYCGSTAGFPLIHALSAVQRQRHTGLLTLFSGVLTLVLACRDGQPVGVINNGRYVPLADAQRLFSTLWTSMDVQFSFDTSKPLPQPDKAEPAGNMLEWAIESLRHVTDEAESSYAWGDSTGIPAFNRSGYDRIQRIALLPEEIAFIQQVDARSSVETIAARLGWPLTKGHQVLFRLLCLEIFDFWPAAILTSQRG
jgi:CheY-like chemotaxis protein